MRIFVAGATGVLGRRVVPQLIAGGHAVTAVARTPQKAAALARQGATPITVDLFTPGAVAAAVTGHEVVINLATAIPPSSRMLWRPAWRTTIRLRTDASRHLVDAALATGATRYIQEALAFVYADHGAAWISEDEPLTRPTYGSDAAEAQARRFDASSGAGIALRFGTFYCADAQATRQMVQAGRRGLLPLPAHPDTYQSWVHVDDAASAVVAALDAPGGVYNAVEDHPLTSAEHAEVLGELLGRRVRSLPAAPLMGGPLALWARSQRVSNRRLREATGWRPAYPSRHAGWTQVLAALQEVTAVA
jgi:nucleoside-diphosphate-sugar epimerase